MKRNKYETTTTRPNTCSIFFITYAHRAHKLNRLDLTEVIQIRSFDPFFYTSVFISFLRFFPVGKNETKIFFWLCACLKPDQCEQSFIIHSSIAREKNLTISPIYRRFFGHREFSLAITYKR